MFVLVQCLYFLHTVCCVERQILAEADSKELLYRIVSSHVANTVLSTWALALSHIMDDFLYGCWALVGNGFLYSQQIYVS